MFLHHQALLQFLNHLKSLYNVRKRQSYFTQASLTLLYFSRVSVNIKAVRTSQSLYNLCILVYMLTVTFTQKSSILQVEQKGNIRECIKLLVTGPVFSLIQPPPTTLYLFLLLRATSYRDVSSLPTSLLYPPSTNLEHRVQSSLIPVPSRESVKDPYYQRL